MHVEVAVLRAASIERSEMSRRSASERVPTGRRAFVERAGELTTGGLIGAVSDLMADEGTKLIGDEELRNGVDQMMRVAGRVAVG